MHARGGMIGRLIAMSGASLVLAIGIPSRAEEAVSIPDAKAELSAIERETAAVVVWGRTVANYRLSLEFQTVAQRAKAASKRVESMLGTFDPEKLRIQVVTIGDSRGVILLADSQFLLSVMEGDLDPGGAVTPDEAAESVASAIRSLALDHAAQHTWSTLLNAIVQSLVATAGFAAFWLGIVWIRTKTTWRLARKSREARGALRFLGYDWRPVLVGIGFSIVRVVFLLLILFCAYVWVAFVLGRFPYTRHWSEQLGGFLVSAVGKLAVGVVHEIPNLAALLVIFLVARGVIRILNGWFAAIESGAFLSERFDSEAARATRRLAGIGIWIVALVVAYPYMPGSHTEAFKGISVFVGLMLTLGGAGFVGQIIGGLAAVYSRAVRVGDFVSIGEIQGTVKELGLFSAKITTRSQEEVTVPNSMLTNSAIRNFSRGEGGATAVTTTLTIGYDTPWREVEKMLCTAAARTEGIREEPAPVVRQTALDDFYARYELNAWVEAGMNRSVALDRLHEHIQDVFAEKGVQIMSPHYNTQPDRPVVPPGNSDGELQESP